MKTVNETINEFKKQQTQTVEILEKLLLFLRNGERYGVEIDPKYKDKLEIGIKATNDDKLKVVLVGGFSEGKTSIAAAWAEKYDSETMKINRQESSDEIVVYSMDNFDIVDTPGLFGFKENAAKERYKEITRKRISEAHLVLYVMDSNNPIKESHEEVLSWLFNDLNLLPRTVFVLSRFDEVADMEDDDSYKEKKEIKFQNIIGRLKDLKLNTVDDISVVAVSADPYEKGIEHWLKHLDEFRKLSRIKSLQDATMEKIKYAGSHTALIEESRKSIATDILKNALPLAEERYCILRKECDKLQQLYGDIEKDLDKTQLRLSEKRIVLRNFIMGLFDDLTLKAQGMHFEDTDAIDDFFVKDIGEEGINVITKIKNEFERQLNSSFHELDKMRISLNMGVDQYNNVIGEKVFYGIKEGGKHLAKGTIVFTNKGLLGARNFIMPTFKFKPWGAIKLAKNLNKVIPLIGIAIEFTFELWDSYDKIKKNDVFQKEMGKMVSEFNSKKKEILELINDEDKFTEEYFPIIATFKNQLEELRTMLQEKQQEYEDFKKWQEYGEKIAIDADFTII